MTKCETRKQLSYSRLGTGISQENSGSNLPLVWQSFIIHKYWHTHQYKWKYDIWTSESLSASKPDLNWVAGNVREEYCNRQTCKMGFPVIINQNYGI